MKNFKNLSNNPHSKNYVKNLNDLKQMKIIVNFFLKNYIKFIDSK